MPPVLDPKRWALAAALFSTVPSLASEAEPISLLPRDCQPSDDCLCLKGDDVDRVSRALVEREQCEARLREMLQESVALAAADRAAAETSWWQEPEMVWGGVVVSFALGGIIGVFAAAHK